MASIIITLLIILLKVPFINILGDKGIGYYSTALIVYLFITTFFSYGLPKVLSEQIIKYGSNGQYKHVSKTIQSSFLFVGITGISATVIFFIFADFIASYIVRAEFCAPSIRGLAPAIIFSGLLGIFHGICMGMKKVSISKIAYIIENLLITILGLIAVFLYSEISTVPDSVESSFFASISYTAGIILVCIFMFVLYLKNRKKIQRLIQKYSENIKDTHFQIIKSMIISMIPVTLTLLIFHTSNLFGYTIFNRIMSVQGHKENSYIILLGMLSGKYEFFISLPLIFVHKHSSNKYPVIKKIVEEGNNKKINLRINQYIRQIMLFIIPCTILFILYAKPLMNLFFTGINDTPSALMRIGAVSILFYSLAIISNSILNAIEQRNSVIKNAAISLIIQIICLCIMMIIFEWGIVAVVIAKIVFSASLCILNEHTLREKLGHVLEKKRTFSIPFMASIVMAISSFLVFIILVSFIESKIAVLFALSLGVITYFFALIIFKGITAREVYRVPFGKYLAPSCNKLHFLH